MLANSGLRRAWLNYCELLRPPVGLGRNTCLATGSLATVYDGGVRCRGVAPSGSSGWRPHLTTHCALPHPSAPLCPPCTGPVFVSDIVYAAEAPHKNGARRGEAAGHHGDHPYCEQHFHGILHLPHSLGADDGLPIILVSQLFLEMTGGGCRPVAKLNPFRFISHIKSRGRSLICHCSCRCLLSS